MSEKTKQVPQLAHTTYAHALVIKSTHEYKIVSPCKLLSIHCIVNFFDLFGFLRHYLLTFPCEIILLLPTYLSIGYHCVYVYTGQGQGRRSKVKVKQPKIMFCRQIILVLGKRSGARSWITGQGQRSGGQSSRLGIWCTAGNRQQNLQK